MYTEKKPKRREIEKFVCSSIFFDPYRTLFVRDCTRKATMTNLSRVYLIISFSRSAQFNLTI